MSSVNNRKSTLALICLFLVFETVSTIHGAEPVSRNSRDLFGVPADGHRNVVGLNGSKCSICHGKVQAPADDLPLDVRGLGNDGWIRGDELLTWVRDDYHYQAFAVLLNDQSREMAKHLGRVDARGNSNIHQDRRCLACHSSMPVDAMESVDDLVSVDTTQDSRYTIGVSCEACHGPAGNRSDGVKGWDDAHVVDREWRFKSSQDKFAKFGYWDVHSTRTQTRICLSCHLGNVEQKKVITHEMYAAGHPPLPSFELSQFVHQMPRHWRRLDEKPKGLRDKFIETQRRLLEDGVPDARFDADEQVVTRATVTAALVTFEESMRLTADLTVEADAHSRWPELANYSCSACHHELQRNGWRRTRRSSLTPGRPSLHEWPGALARASIIAMGKNQPNDLIDTAMSEVVIALNSRPFGNRSELGSAALNLAMVAEIQSRDLSTVHVDRLFAEALLNAISELATNETVDYDSARQLVWAYERISAELTGKSTPGGKVEKGLTEIPVEWSTGHSTLDGFQQYLILSLRRNRDSAVTVNLSLGSAAKMEHLLRNVDVSKSFQFSSNYDPRLVQQKFKELRRAP